MTKQDYKELGFQDLGVLYFYQYDRKVAIIAERQALDRPYICLISKDEYFDGTLTIPITEEFLKQMVE